MISKRGWYNDLGINANAGNLMVNRFRQGNLSAEKIDEVLGLAGYQVVNEKQWAEPGESVSVKSVRDINATARRIDSDMEVFLVDKPENYWSGFIDWNFLHNHMYPADTSYQDMLKYYDLYLIKVKEQENE